MKKVISLILSILMLTSITAGIDFSALANTTNPRIKMVVSDYLSDLDYGYTCKNSIKSEETNKSAKAGDKISISFILSGIDNIEAFEVKGLWDSTVLTPGYYTHKSTGDIWNTITPESGQIDTPIIQNTKDLTKDGKWIDGHSFLNAETSRMYLCTYCMEGHDLPQTSTSQCYDEETKIETPYAIDGCTMFIVGFEVLKDVDNVYSLFDWDADTRVTHVVAGNGTNYGLSGDNAFAFGDSCEHSDSYETGVVKPTCYNPGYTKHTCSECGSAYYDNYTNKSHDYDECTSNNDGTHSKTCKYCGHTETCNCSYTSIATSPTCTKQGYTTYTCSECGYSYVDNYTDAIGHNYSAWKSNSNGTHSKTCANCGDAITENCNFDEKIIEPTCTEDGYTLHVCKDCGYSYKDNYTDKTMHSFGDWTSNNNGTHSEICSKCNGIQTEQCSYDVKIVEPTCSTVGTKTYICSVCGDTYTETIPKLTHNYETSITRAIASKSDGRIESKCSICGDTKPTIIPMPKTYTLSGTSYAYNGNVKTPSVTVKDSKGTVLKKNTDYTVTYASGRKYVGKYSVKITFKGNYSGTKTLYFTIKPPVTAISSLSAGSKRFTAKWSKKSAQVTGYQIQYATNSSFKSAKISSVTSYKTTSRTISKLYGKKRYYVRIRTYKKVGNTNYYSSWSKTKYVTTKA